MSYERRRSLRKSGPLLIQVVEPRLGRRIGHVHDSQLILALRFELPIHQIRRRPLLRVRPRSHHEGQLLLSAPSATVSGSSSSTRLTTGILSLRTQISTEAT